MKIKQEAPSHQPRRASNSTLDVAHWFNNDNFSDLTIKFADRDVRCHKLVLCSKSDYFQRMCGADASLKEKDQQVIELKEDDPDALFGYLRYLYTGEYYSEGDPREKDCTFHLFVSAVANKYGASDLEELARQEFKDRMLKLEDVSEVQKVLEVARSDDFDEKLIKTVDKVEKKHLQALVKLPEYRKMLESDADLMWKNIESLAWAASLTKLTIVHCPCGNRQVWQDKELRYKTCNRCKTREYKVKTAWVSEHEKKDIMDCSELIRSATSATPGGNGAQGAQTQA